MANPGHKTNVKETLVNLVIAFVIAFVARGFVIEAFVIPTGSMAPTLNGAHIRFHSPQSGFDFAVNPWDTQAGNPTSRQGTMNRPIQVRDPMTGWPMEAVAAPTKWGDRIFVLKYLYSLYDPRRFDVVVFKNPRDPTVNYIKRLVGLPNDQLALVDGDLFVRTRTPADDPNLNPWELPGWRTVPRPDRAQGAMWQPVADARFSPIRPERDGRRWYRSPWSPRDDAGQDLQGWTLPARGPAEYAGSGPTRLEWDSAWRALDDWYWYNQGPAQFMQNLLVFPVSDVRVSAALEPQADLRSAAVTLQARDHAFEARLTPDGAIISMRRIAGNPPGDTPPWTVLATALADPAWLRAGSITPITFEHVDQRLRLRIHGRLIVDTGYDWSPAQRITFATGRTIEQIMADPDTLAMPSSYKPARLAWSFEGGPLRLHGLRLDRDIYYQPRLYGGTETAAPHSKAGTPAAASHPSTTMTLGPDQFFVLGDNSPQSLDNRLGDLPSPYVAAIDPAMGVVTRDLLIGKAFFVYFPSPDKSGPVFMPDFGRLRFIW